MNLYLNFISVPFVLPSFFFNDRTALNSIGFSPLIDLQRRDDIFTVCVEIFFGFCSFVFSSCSSVLVLSFVCFFRSDFSISSFLGRIFGGTASASFYGSRRRRFRADDFSFRGATSWPKSRDSATNFT